MIRKTLTICILSLFCSLGYAEFRIWEDKDGNKRYITEVVVSEFLLLTRKEEVSTSDKEATDLPF